MAVLLQAQGMTRRFGGLVAVDDVSFDVNDGEIFGLIGPNGAGKTTLFNLITGLIAPTKGTLSFRGQPITNLPPYAIAARGIARTFQNIRLFGNLSALENVMIARHLHMTVGLAASVLGTHRALAEEQAVRGRCAQLLALVGLEQRADELAKNLSYGDQRRLEIVRALSLEPALLLLDEPAAGMNPNEKRELIAFIRQIHDQFKLTILVIEHNVPLVMGLCDRVAVLNFGQLIALGPPAAVQTNPAVIEAYLGS